MQRIAIKLVFSLLALWLLPALALAQPGDIEVTGKVIDAVERAGMPGVSILLKGTARGTTTDFDGKYKIKVPAGGVLVFKSLGYVPQEIPVKANLLNVTLKEEGSGVTTGEVVVTGRKSVAADLTPGTTTQLIDAGELKKAPVAAFTDALQGRAPGVQVTQSSGIAGSAVRIQVRGTGSISAGSEPLYVVDGVPITTGAGGDGGGAIGANSSSLGFQTNALADINSADIENVEVLKDAAATAQYGARGANGVVIITTKRGKPGKTRFNASYYRGATNLTNRVGLLNGPEYMQVLTDAYENSFRSNRFNVLNNRQLPSMDNWVTFPRINAFSAELAAQTNTNWMDLLLNENAPMQEATISGSGGSDRTTFYMGASVFDQKGILTGNSFNRFGGRFNLDNKANDKLMLGVSTAITYSINNLVPSGATLSGQGGFGMAQTRSLPIFPVYFPQQLPNGSVPFNPFPFNPYFQPYSGTNIALTSNTDYAFRRQEVFRNLSNFYLEYRLTDRTKFRLEPGFDFRNQVDRGYESRYLRLSELGLQQPAASASDSRVMTLNYNVNAFVNHVHYFTEDIKLTANVGTNYQRSDFYNNGVTSEQLPNDNTTLVSSGLRQVGRSGNQSSFAFLAYYGNGTLDLGGGLSALASVRYEGSSRFGVNGRFGLFSGAGLAYLLSERPFLKELDWVDVIKLKLSYGRTGNASSLDNFQSYGLYTSGATYNLLPGTRPRRVANPDLTWEKTDQLDAGVEYSLFKDRISGSFTYFNKTSFDLLLGLPAAPSLGIEDNTILRNIGRMRNQGLEVQITTRNFDKSFNASDENRKWGISWTTSFNVTLFTNRVLDIGGLKPNEVTGSPDFNTYVGQQVATFFLPAWAGVDPQTGQELIYRAERDANGQLTGRRTNETFRPTTVGQLDSNRVPFFDKPIQPKLFGGLNNTLRVWQFDISALITFQYGNYILDQGERRQSYVTGQTNLRRDLLNAWQKPGDVTNVPVLYYSNAPGVFASGDPVERGPFIDDPYRNRNTSRFLHDGSYARLKTVSIGFNLKKEWLTRAKLESARVYVNANNLFTWTRFPGWDPEVMGNLQSNQERNLQQGRTDLDFPQVKTIVAGVNISF